MFFGCFYCWLHLFISPTLGFFNKVSSSVFISQIIFTIVFHQLPLPWLFFCTFLFFGTSFLCCCTASAMDLRGELFLVSNVFYLTLLPNILHNLLSSRLPWEPAVLLAGPSTEVRNIDPVHLFVWITQCSVKGISC